MWRQTEHGQGEWKIQPFDVMAVAVVANATAKNADGEATAVVPTFQRLGKRAAELLRAAKGDADGNGVYDFTLNAPQGGDTTLIVNRPDEIADFFAQIAVAGGAAAPANPVLHFYFNQFTLSHNVVPKAGNPANGRYILGSPAGGGCVMCHSDSSNPQSVGFFDRSQQLFAQPLDGGAGLVQTVLAAAAPLSGDLERVSIKFPYSIPIESGTTLPSTFAATPLSTAVNLSNGAGQTVGNTVNQGMLLGYGAEQLALLKSPITGSYAITASAATGGGDITNGAGVSVLGTKRVPGLTDVTYTIAPQPGYFLYALAVSGQGIPVTSTGMTYTFTRVGSDQTIYASFLPTTYPLAVQTLGQGQGTISTADTEPDISCTANAGTCSGSAATFGTVTLAAQPAPGSSVSAWRNCTPSADLLTCTTTMNDAKTVTAQFDGDTYPLTVQASGEGTVTTADTEPDIACSSTGGTCSASAAGGSTVTLGATAASGWYVSGWTGCTTVAADKLSCTATMSSAKTVTVTFKPSAYLLTVQTSGMGVVSSADTDPDVSCSENTGTCSASAAAGSTVTLKAAPAAGAILYAWAGCSTVSSDRLGCTVAVTGAKTVYATFLPDAYTLTVKTLGSGQGTVSAVDTEPDLACSANAGTCSGIAPINSTVTLSAVPAAGSAVSGWRNCAASADKLTCKVTMNAAKTVTATFSASP
jgi:hypothetical protein